MVNRSSYNEMIKLLHDKKFDQLIAIQKGELRKIGNKQTKEFIISCRKAIKEFILSKNMSLSWLQPIYSSIVNDDFDFPLEGGISLKVGDEEITLNTPQEILIIKNKKTGEIIEPKNISIVVTAKTSIDRLINFIKEYGKAIEYYQNIIELPEYKRLGWRNINLGLEIIEMKDDKNMTFAKIANILSEKEDFSEKDQDYYSDENNIKTIYYRFKKRLK